MALIEKWRACVDDGQVGRAILTVLFYIFDCISHQ